MGNPFEDIFAAWEFVSEEKNEVLVQGFVFRCVETSLYIRIKLKGLDLEQKYVDENTGNEYSGAALMSGGIILDPIVEDNSSFQIFFRKK